MTLCSAVKKLGENTKQSLCELKKDAEGFIAFLRNNKLTVILIWFFLLLAYGIKLFNYSISIDTEAIINNYDGQLNDWVSIGRFGLILTKKLFGLAPFNPYVACLLMLCAMVVFCLTCAYSFNYFIGESSNKSIVSFIFPIMFLTSPLFAEQFNFILQGFEVAFAIILTSLAFFFISKWVISTSNIVHFILGMICMVWGFATYQAILPLYISGILACYILIYISNKKDRIILGKNFFKTAVVKYSVTFIIGVGCYYLLNCLFTSASGTTSYLNDSQMVWGKVPASECIRNILTYIKQTVKGDSLFYSRIFIFVVILMLIYAIANLFTRNKNRMLFLLSVCALLGSPYFLSIYLGRGLIIRSQFSFQFVIAFGLYLLVLLIKNKKLQTLGIILAAFLAFNQGYVVSRLLYSDYMKYQSEVTLANKISARIENLNLGEIPEYPIVFVGPYHPTNTPLELSKETIGYSFFEWDAGTPFNSNYRILGFMRTIGYPYVAPNKEQIDAGTEIAENIECWPNTDSVQFAEDIIVVKLSD